MKEFVLVWLPSLSVILTVFLAYWLTGRAMTQATRQSDERARKDRLVELRDQWLLRLRLTIAELLASLREFRRLTDIREALGANVVGADVRHEMNQLGVEIQKLEFRIPLLRLETAFLLRPGSEHQEAVWQSFRAMNIRAAANQLIPAIEDLENRARSLIEKEWNEIQEMAK